MGSPWRIDPTTHRTMSERSYNADDNSVFIYDISENVLFYLASPNPHLNSFDLRLITDSFQ